VMMLSVGKKLSSYSAEKQKIHKVFFFFCKRTNNIHKFDGCFLMGQVNSKGFNVFSDCIVEP